MRAYCSGVAIMWTSGEERESVTELCRTADRGAVHGVVYAAAAAAEGERRSADSMCVSECCAAADTRVSGPDVMMR